MVVPEIPLYLSKVTTPKVKFKFILENRLGIRHLLCIWQAAATAAANCWRKHRRSWRAGGAAGDTSGWLQSIGPACSVQAVIARAAIWMEWCHLYHPSVWGQGAWSSWKSELHAFNEHSIGYRCCLPRGGGRDLPAGASSFSPISPCVLNLGKVMACSSVINWRIYSGIPLLRKVHWLPLSFCAQFKVLVCFF